MKKGKLHTLSKYEADRLNEIAFMPKDNIFVDGGEVDTSTTDNNDNTKLKSFFQGPSKEKMNTWANSWLDKQKSRAQDAQDYNTLIGLPSSQGAVLNTYKQSKNWLGISKQANPFSKINIGRTVGAIAPALGSAIGGLGKKLISNGYKTGVGEGIASFGSTIGGAIGTVNPLVGGIVSAASGIIGGVYNAGMGVKLNDKLIGSIKDNSSRMSQAGNALAQASTNAMVMDAAKNMASGMDINYKNLGSTGFLRTNRRLKREAARLTNAQNLALAKQAHGLMTGAMQADQSIDDNAASSFIAAEGGQLDIMDNNMGPTLYNLLMNEQIRKDKLANKSDTPTYNYNYFGTGASDNVFARGGKIHINPKNKGKFNALKKRTGKTTEELTHSKNPLTRKRAIFAQNARKWRHDDGGYLNLFSGEEPLNILCGGGKFFDLGGDIQMHGGDYSTGLTHVNAGDSHEMNPNEGVQMGVDGQGTPNLVEEGETVYNDYVYSARIEMDDEAKERFHINKKRNYTYAEFSKKLEKEAAERPNDPISQASLKAQLSDLADEQERQKAEMEAERAREAFEELSPEEQTAVMQQASQEEQAAQEQAMQEEAMAQQQMQQQPTPEEAAMMQQQMAMQQMPQEQMMQTEPQMGQQPIIGAYGGEINKFDDGGVLRNQIYNALGIHTDPEFIEWVKKNNVNVPFDLDGDYSDLDDDSYWKVLLMNPSFTDAVAKENPALADVIKRGYKLGANIPVAKKATIMDVSRGNWDEHTGKGWMPSNWKTDKNWRKNPNNDLAFIQAIKDLTDEQVAALDTEQLANLMRNTDAYKNTSKWLEDPENARMYLKAVVDNEKSPTDAVNYALKFIDKEGNWRKGFEYAYNKVFGTDTTGVRGSIPGSFWHSVVEANRGNKAANFVINDDGSIYEIRGDVPGDWTFDSDYSWDDDANSYLYKYYRRPAVAAKDGDTGDAGAAGTGTDTKNPSSKLNVNKILEPLLKRETNFGMYAPLFNLALMEAGVGKPDYSGFDKAMAIANRGPALASYQPIGDYVKYTPFDLWAEQNRLDANNRSLQRSMLNQVAPSRDAGLVALAYQENNGAGQLKRQLAQAEDTRKLQYAAHNKETNLQNANAFNTVSQFNANQLNDYNQFLAQMQYRNASDRLEADASWYNSIYGNVNKMAENISAMEKENRDWNWTAKMLASGLVPGVNPNNPLFNGMVGYTAEGGRINRRKNKKRGLTI